MDLRVGILSCCFDDIRNAFDRESLCFGAERACDSVSSKAPTSTCLRCVKHHFIGSMLVFEAGHIYFFYKQNEIEGESCCSKQPNRLSIISKQQP